MAEYQRPLLAQDDLARVMELEMRALPAAIRMQVDGTPFDPEIWMPLAEQAELDFAAVTREIMQLIGPEYAGINLRSYPQRMELLRARGHRPGKVQWVYRRAAVAGLHRRRDAARATADLGRPAAGNAPALVEIEHAHHALRGRLPTEHVKPDGRLHGGYRAVGTATGRATCSQPNLLQIPREGPGSEYRRAFRAAAWARDRAR